MKKLVVLVVGLFVTITSFTQSVWVNTWIPDNKDCSNLFIANQNFENNLSRFIIFDSNSNSADLLLEVQKFVDSRYNSVIEPEYSIEVLNIWFDDLGNVDVIDVHITDNVALHPNNFVLDDIPKSFKTDLRNIESSYAGNVLFEEIQTVFNIFNKN